MTEISNPSFNGVEINAPEEYREIFQRYSRSAGAASISEMDRRPFPRMVDFWFLAVCVAVNLDLQPVSLEGVKTYKAIESNALSNPPWRLNALRLIAIGRTGDPSVIQDARKVMRIANELAFAGMPKLVDMLSGYDNDVIFGLCDEMELLLKGSVGKAA